MTEKNKKKNPEKKHEVRSEDTQEKQREKREEEEEGGGRWARADTLGVQLRWINVALQPRLLATRVTSTGWNHRAPPYKAERGMPDGVGNPAGSVKLLFRLWKVP